MIHEQMTRSLLTCPSLLAISQKGSQPTASNGTGNALMLTRRCWGLSKPHHVMANPSTHRLCSAQPVWPSGCVGLCKSLGGGTTQRCRSQKAGATCSRAYAICMALPLSGSVSSNNYCFKWHFTVSVFPSYWDHMYQISPCSNRLLYPVNTYNSLWDQRGCWLMSHKDILDNTGKVTAAPHEWQKASATPVFWEKDPGNYRLDSLSLRVNPPWIHT